MRSKNLNILYMFTSGYFSIYIYLPLCLQSIKVLIYNYSNSIFPKENHKKL